MASEFSKRSEQVGEIIPYANDVQLTVSRFTAPKSPRKMDMIPTATHIIPWLL